MKFIEKRQLGTKGARREITVSAEIARYGGSYRVRIIERKKGAADRIPMSAEGIGDEKNAWEMLRVFESNYVQAERQSKDSFFQSTQSTLTDANGKRAI